jgi:UDP-N-acetylmuramate dehydrogenase
MSDEAIARAQKILRDACGDRVRSDFPLASLTTFRIGGPAALFLEPESDLDLGAASLALRGSGLPFALLGRGSNVLVADAGFPGLVLRLGRGFRWVARDGGRLMAGGAMPLPALAGVALRHELSGLEFGVAIPATLGGAVRMNAGAHTRDLASIVENVTVFRLDRGVNEMLPAEKTGFTYRGTTFPADRVVVGASLALESGDPVAIRAQMDEARRWRRRTQPLAEPNCGSVFKNPPDGPAAATLVEEAGAKGLREGGARISTKHANFIVAAEGARAGDVLALIERVRDMVEERTGIRLEPEVQLIGGPVHAGA